MRRRLVTLTWLVICGVGCSTEAGSTRAPDGAYAMLSQWELFSDLPSLTPRAGVIPYEVNSPLFTDYAAKHRFLFVPEGEQITYRAQGAWEFPVGSVLVKVFAHKLDAEDPSSAERILETRLMIHADSGWEPEVYVWNEAQTDAERVVSGELIELDYTAADAETRAFEYAVPTRSECRKCHGAISPVTGAQPTRVLGPMTAQLHREHDYGAGPENQIDHLADLGLLSGNPEPAAARLSFAEPDDESVPVLARARAYLASNCAHCHAPDGETLDKDLWLDFQSTDLEADPYHYGVCKKPTSAGNADCSAELDIVPGDPDASLMVCRMELLGKGQMAPLGRNRVHAEGVELIRQWIAGLDLPGCSAEL